MSTLSWEKLLKGCREGHLPSQRKLYDHFAPKMLGVCYRYARNKEDAEDILQEGFVKIFQKLQGYKHTGSFEGWIRRIIVNTAVDHLRKEKKRMFHTAIDETVSESLSVGIIDNMSVEHIFETIQTLSDGYRLIFNLYAIEGYSHKEIAARLDITESTSRSQYTRARAILKQKISESFTKPKVYKDVI